MPDGVLDERLQDQGRHQDVVESGFDVQLHGEPVLKTHLFDLQIAFEEGEFLAQRHFLGVGLFQADAQQFAEPGYDPVGILWILMDQGGDDMERVKQEVRVQLHAQHLQSRPHQFGGQSRGLRFALAIPPIIVPPEMRQHDHPIDDHGDVTVINDQFPEHAAELKRGAVYHRFLAAQKPGINREVNQGDDDARSEVAQNPAFHAFPFEIPAARHPQYADG